MFFRQKKAGKRTYLQVVENHWDNGKVRQKVFMTVGRLDRLRESGKLDSLLASGARFSESALVITADDQGETTRVRSLKIGPALLLERLWKEDGLSDLLERFLDGRRFGFPVERAIFLSVLHRLFALGSDRAAAHWKEGYKIEGVEEIDLHHLYQAMAWLGERLPEDQQDPVAEKNNDKKKKSTRGTPPPTRFTKDLIEESLFKSRRTLFSSLSMVFFDTTFIYFEGEGGGEDLGRQGKTKEHRPDLKQMVVGMVLDQDGFPLFTEMWPGSTADVKSLVPVVERLRSRFGIEEVCIVSDRGMISNETIGKLEKMVGISYCTIDQEKAGKEARYDGKWVLATNTDLSTEEVALQYNRLWVVKSIFGTMKSILDTLPIYQQSEAALRGHVFCSFLALRMMVLLRKKVAEMGKEVEWERAMQELDEITLTEIRHNNKGYQLRSDVRSNASILLRAAGVKLPPTLIPMGHTAPDE